MKNNSLSCFRDKKILVVVAHPDDESLYFFGGLKALSQVAHLQIVCATYSRSSYRGQELLSVCRSLGLNCHFLGIRDLGMDSMLENLESVLGNYLNLHAFDLLITHPPHGGEKPHPHHLQVFLESLNFCLNTGKKFAFFSEDRNSLCENAKSDSVVQLCFRPLIVLYIFQVVWNLKWKYRFLWIQTVLTRILVLFLRMRKKYFARYEIESLLSEKQNYLRKYFSQQTAIQSYQTAFTTLEYLFFMKSFEIANTNQGPDPDIDLKAYHALKSSAISGVGFI